MNNVCLDLAARAIATADAFLIGAGLCLAGATAALTLLRGHHAMKESRADVLNWLNEARGSIGALPDGPARAAFLALCDFVEKRTG